jgi:hypothetical protein
MRLKLQLRRAVIDSLAFPTSCIVQFFIGESSNLELRLNLISVEKMSS